MGDNPTDVIQTLCCPRSERDASDDIGPGAQAPDQEKKNMDESTGSDFETGGRSFFFFLVEQNIDVWFVIRAPV